MSKDKNPWIDEGIPIEENLSPWPDDGGDGKDRERFDVAAGYKECSLDSAHVYPASYPGSACPEGDGGTLNLVML